MYHSEPITRTLVGKYHANKAKKYTEGHKFLEEWEQIISADATREERISYFGIGSPTLLTFGLMGLPVFMLGLIASLYAEISLWYVIVWVLTPAMIFSSLSFGFHGERSKSLKDEHYPASFSSSLMVFYSLAGVLVALILGYLLTMALG